MTTTEFSNNFEVLWNSYITKNPFGDTTSLQKPSIDEYEKSVLLFPSYIETIGLPILEARAVKSPILLSDCLYSKSIAGNYELADFFKYDDPETLAKLMAKFI